MSPSDTRLRSQDEVFMQAIMELSISGTDFFEEQCFGSILEREKKRSRRSGKTLILVLVNMTGLTDTQAPARLNSALASRIRETDFRGWYQQGSIFGVLFTALNTADAQARDSLYTKLLDALSSALAPEDLSKVDMMFSTFPAGLGDPESCGRFDASCVNKCSQEGARYTMPFMSIPARLYDFLKISSAIAYVAKIIKRSKYRVASGNAEYQQR